MIENVHFIQYLFVEIRVRYMVIIQRYWVILMEYCTFYICTHLTKGCYLSFRSSCISGVTCVA